MTTYKDMIKAIRQFDQATPILIESSYWAHVDFLDKIDIQQLLSVDNNLMFSFHFYEPQQLTCRSKNNNRFQYPGNVKLLKDSQWKNELIDDQFIER